MRKIETQMNDAISSNANWTKANTSVTTQDGVSAVRLHGNLIAEIGDNFIRLFDGGWQSNTTKSRLNAILSVSMASKAIASFKRTLSGSFV